MNELECQYRCMSCGYKFTSPRPMMVNCPKCASVYVTWKNHQEVIQYLMKTDKEYAKYYSNG